VLLSVIHSVCGVVILELAGDTFPAIGDLFSCKFRERFCVCVLGGAGSVRMDSAEDEVRPKSVFKEEEATNINLTKRK